MDSSLENLIQINATGLVLMTCNSHDICDPAQIDKYKSWIVKSIIVQLENKNAGVEALSKVMDEKIALLNLHLGNGTDLPIPESQTDNNQVNQDAKEEAQKINQFYDLDHIPPVVEKSEPAPKPPKSSSKGTDMPTKLSEERKPIKKLIQEDCVQLGLITKKRAEYVITQMAGKQPVDAEKEVVVELRENLHKQVRKLIRKDKGGPWSSPKDQEDLRLEILHTPSVRAVLFITRDILREREQWLERSHSGITGRIFGSKMSLDK